MTNETINLLINLGLILIVGSVYAGRDGSIVRHWDGARRGAKSAHRPDYHIKKMDRSNSGKRIVNFIICFVIEACLLNFYIGSVLSLIISAVVMIVIYRGNSKRLKERNPDL